MTRLENVLDFALSFAEELIVSGANLERVNDTIYRVCEAYDCREAHFFSLSCYVSLSLKDQQGNTVCSQRCIRDGMDTNLEKLHRLNQLSRHICTNKPEPEKLDEMLTKAVDFESYPHWMIAAGRLLAMTCIAKMNGSCFTDMTVIWLNTVLLLMAGFYVSKPGINKIVYNGFCTFVTGSIALTLYHVGYVQDFYVVIIVTSMMMIPGIVAVNAFRNILCGNEINGILEFFKAVLETVAIVGGFVLCIFLFGGNIL